MFLVAVFSAITAVSNEYHCEISRTTYQFSNCTGNYYIWIIPETRYCSGDNVSCCDQKHSPPDPSFGICTHGNQTRCYCTQVPPDPEERNQIVLSPIDIGFVVFAGLLMFWVFVFAIRQYRTGKAGYEVIQV
jgi:hypothetical protein